jgi:hypothetical protein
MVLVKLGIHMQKSEIRPFFTQHTKINSKQIMYLSTRPDNVKS